MTINCLAPNVNSAEVERPCTGMRQLRWSYGQAQVRVGAEKERTLVMETTFKVPQGPYQICARVFKTGEWNK